MITFILMRVLRFTGYQERLARAGRPLYAALKVLPSEEEDRCLLRSARVEERRLRRLEAGELAEAFWSSLWS